MTVLSISDIKSDVTSGEDTPEEEAEIDTPAAINMAINKRSYPYGPLFFIMAATIGQR